MKHIKINKNDENQRLDRFLLKLYPLMNKSLIQKYIRTKKIKLNKKRTNNSEILKEGDILDIYIYDEVLEKYEEKKKEVKSSLNLDIIYEDENIIIVDKPKGVLSHAASSDDFGVNVVDFIVDYLIENGEYNPKKEHTFRPSIVNRLDFNTEGLIIGCKNSNALRIFNDAIKDGSIEKYYRAVVYGKIVKEINIDESITKVENNVMKIDKYGKESKTIVKPIKFCDRYSYIDIKLVTGRTHQIRVHMSSINHPIVGDRKYDKIEGKVVSNKPNINSQLLLAYKLVFNDIKGLEYLNNREYISNMLIDFDKLANKIIN